MHSTLLLQFLKRSTDIAFGKLLHHLFQFWVFWRTI